MRHFLFAVIATVIGCNGGAQQGRGVHQVSWSHAALDQPTIAGIDEACVMFGTYGDSAAIILWTDGAGGSFGAGWDKPREAVHYSGRLKSQDARLIDVNAFTADGRTGEVTIDGQKFDLAKGTLFLIKTDGGETQVKQSSLKIPQPDRKSPDQAKSYSDTLREFANSNEEISGFFGFEE